MSSTAKPLTPEEEAEYRENFINGSGAFTDSDDIRRLLATLDAARLSHDRGAEGLDAIREEVRQAVIEGDASDCSSPDCIADAVYEILRVRLSVPAPTKPALDAETLARVVVMEAHPNDPELWTDAPMNGWARKKAERILEALRDAV